MNAEELALRLSNLRDGEHLCTVARGPDVAGEELEKIPLSRFSQRPVGDEELLVRLLLSPFHIDPATGRPHPFAFKDVENKGMSVIRADGESHESLCARGLQKAEHSLARSPDSKVTFEGYISVRCERVRQLRDEVKRRHFHIFDTAKESDHAHADICQADKSRSARRKLQAEFDQIIRKPSDVS